MAPNDSGALASITFGDHTSNYIQKSMVSGSSFSKGSEVEFAGNKYKITQEVDSDGDLTVEPEVIFSATLDTSMTEANMAGFNIGVPGAILAAAFLPRWY